MELKIAVRQGAEVSVQFLFGQMLRHQPPRFLHEQFALLLFRADKFGAASHQPHGLMVQRPKQGIFEAVPQLIAGGQRIDKSVQRQQRQRFGVLHPFSKVPDDGRVIQVAPLRGAGHQQVVFNHQPQPVGGCAVQTQPAGHAQGEPAADLAMIAVTLRFADVVEQQGKIKHEWAVQPLEQRRIGFVRRAFGFPDPVKLLQAH